MITYDASNDLKIQCLKRLLLGIGLYFSPIVVGAIALLTNMTSPIVLLVMATIALGLRLSAFYFWAIATGDLAESRGQSRWWSLIGLLPFLGTLFVLFLPDRSRQLVYTVNRL